MKQSRTMIDWTCDRCGADVSLLPPDYDAQRRKPNGWVRVEVEDADGRVSKDDLCEVCAVIVLRLLENDE